MLDEIAKGIARYPVLGEIAGLPWLRSVEIDLAELAAFATYKSNVIVWVPATFFVWILVVSAAFYRGRVDST
ncbi:MAG: hypothetical protein ACYCV7_10445 [Acidimicrobiales bacterium]